MPFKPELKLECVGYVPEHLSVICRATYNGVTNEITKVSGAPDLGNATSSGYSNVVLLPNWSLT